MNLAKYPPAPWTAPSASIYAADGLMVCTLGDRQSWQAYRDRGDTAGRMLADTGYLIAAAPGLLNTLEMIEQLADPLTDCMSDAGKLRRIRELALAAIASTVRPLSPSERGEIFIVPLFGLEGSRN